MQSVYPNQRIHCKYTDRHQHTELQWDQGRSKPLLVYQIYVCKPAGSSKSVLVKPAREVTATEVKV